jgi:GNAT superfamily N-acetyltransferase
MTSLNGPRIRPIAPGDEIALERFYADLSVDSREARFLGATPALSGGAAHYLSGADHRHRQGFVAEAVTPDGRLALVGHVCLEPVGGGAAEIAVAVADAWQHHGIGRSLLAASLAWARRHGIEQLVASMRWSNGPMLGLLRSMGYPVHVGTEDAGVVDIVIDLTGGLPRAA